MTLGSFWYQPLILWHIIGRVNLPDTKWQLENRLQRHPRTKWQPVKVERLSNFVRMSFRLKLAHTPVSCTLLLFFDILWYLYCSVVPLYRLLKRCRVRWYFNLLNNRKGSVPVINGYTVYKINLIEPEAKKLNKNVSSYTFGYIYLMYFCYSGLSDIPFL